ncbi:hypothetical protein PR202_ga14702 [Eleusine coracana subsp. coracana]|uniref:Uncharacterized protein n=1 Tax=Eleusine coracana subsp. coracana TaxID=191504 RepID=A0AAV5CI62_ELECO|nr:hypothetical protein PR202_ga14702 [Eleusine coracana subsp. coracana]
MSVGEVQGNTTRASDEMSNEDCENGGSVIEATISSEDLNEGHGSDSNSQCAESDGACKEVSEMELQDQYERKLSNNDDNSGCADEMPEMSSTSSSAIATVSVPIGVLPVLC